MQSSIHKLDENTAKSIQASLIFPTLTSIVLEVVYKALECKPISRIQLLIHFAPEWQITCEFDALDNSNDSILGSQQQRDEGSVLTYLSYLGLLDIQRGSHKLVQRSGHEIFSGVIGENEGEVSFQRSCTITLRDIFCNLPIRRKALSSSENIRSEVERCRKALSVIALPNTHLYIKLKVKSIEEASDRTILDIHKTGTSLQRYEKVFGIPVASPDFALPIAVKEEIGGGTLQINGFIILSLLSSRTHQHVLLNGKYEAEADLPSFANTGNRRGSIEDVVLQVLHSSYIAEQSPQKATRSNSERVARHFGYYLDIRFGKLSRLDGLIVESTIKDVFSEFLSINGLLKRQSEQKSSPTKRTSRTGDEDSPTKRSKGANMESLRNGHRFTLDRSSLLREPKEANEMNSESSSAWLTDILKSWKNMSATISDERSECRIPSILDFSSRGNSFSTSNDTFDREANSGLTLKKSGLESCRLIGQVDRKYISILYNDDTLAFIDQHAAHERIRLEASLSEYTKACLAGTSAKQLSPDGNKRVFLTLPSNLIKAFDGIHNRAALAFWGFHLCIEKEEEEGSILQVEAVPDLLYEKLSNEQTRLHFFTELAIAMEEEIVCRRLMPSTLSREKAEGMDGWTLALRHLPEPVLEMFNSIACRGAISELEKRWKPMATTMNGLPDSRSPLSVQ